VAIPHFLGTYDDIYIPLILLLFSLKTFLSFPKITPPGKLLKKSMTAYLLNSNKNSPIFFFKCNNIIEQMRIIILKQVVLSLISVLAKSLEISDGKS
jgi:hypothetical protein